MFFPEANGLPRKMVVGRQAFPLEKAYFAGGYIDLEYIKVDSQSQLLWQFLSEQNILKKKAAVGAVFFSVGNTMTPGNSGPWA